MMVRLNIRLSVTILYMVLFVAVFSLQTASVHVSYGYVGGDFVIPKLTKDISISLHCL